MKGAITLTFLGTGTSQGIPVIGSDHPVCLSTDIKDKRLRSSVLIEGIETNVIIDCGPDFRQQLLNNPVKRLDAVLITHEHADHTMGLDDIRPFFFRQGDMQFYATEKVFRALSQRFDYIFDENYQYPGVPEITKNYIAKNIPFKVKEFQFLPIEVDHAGMQVLGFRIGRLAYVTDIKHISEDQIALLDNLDILIINALRHEPHHSHLSLCEAIDLGKRIGANKTYFTHISHTMGFHNEVSADLPEGFFLAYDNLKLEFDSNE